MSFSFGWCQSSQTSLYVCCLLVKRKNPNNPKLVLLSYAAILAFASREKVCKRAARGHRSTAYRKNKKAAQSTLLLRLLGLCEAGWWRDERHGKIGRGATKKKRFECMRSYCACSPPAGESTDQRPFIIWCCKNKTPFSLQLGRTAERTRDKKDDQRWREGQKGWAQPKKSHYSKNIKEQTLESISEEW